MRLKAQAITPLYDARMVGWLPTPSLTGAHVTPRSSSPQGRSSTPCLSICRLAVALGQTSRVVCPSLIGAGEGVSLEPNLAPTVPPRQVGSHDDGVVRSPCTP